MNNEAFKLVKSELVQSLQAAEQAFDAFVVDPSDLEQLNECSAIMNRLRGTFALMEDEGISKLCATISSSLDALVTEQSNKRLMQACSNAILVVGRYVEYREVGDPVFPDLMLEEINRLRLAAGQRPHPVDWFHPLQIKADWLSQQPVKLSGDQARLRRVHALSQAGLVQIVRSERLQAVFRALSELYERAGRGQKDRNLGSLFTALAELCDASARGEPFINKDRLRFFAQCERALAELVNNQVLAANVINDIKRQTAYLLSLQANRSASGDKLLQALGVQRASIDDAFLAEQYRLLHGPGANVLQSVSDALLEELADIREHIEQVERQGTQLNLDTQKPRIAGVGEALAMVGLTSAANVVKQLLKKLTNASDLTDSDLLAQVADGLIYAETAAARLKTGRGEGAQSSPNQASAAAVHDHARIALIDEAEQGIAVVKRAVSAYMDHGGDKLHLTNVDASLRGVRGACVFLGAQRAAHIVDMVARFIEERLLNAGQEINQQSFDYMAEALSGLEFYLEALLTGSSRADDLLGVAEKNLAQLAV